MRTKVINIKLSELKEFPGNPQEVPDEKMDAIVDNMKRRGWYGEWPTIACFDKKKKIIVDDFSKGDWFKISGNHRVKAAIRANIKEHKSIAVVDKSYTWEQACKDNIMFNNLHGEPNEEKLGHFIQDIIENYSVDMDDIAVDTGLSEQDISRILDTTIEVDNEQDDLVPEIDKSKVKSKLGDLYLLNNHRVLCGDSTDIECVNKLMEGKKADMVLTDPPYGINVIKKNSIGGRGPVGGKKNYKKTIGGNNIVKANIYNPIVGDDKPFEPILLLSLADKQIIFGANYFASRLPDSRGWLVWDKIDGMEGTTKNFSDFEMAWTNFEKPARLFRHRWQGLMKGSEKNEKRIHPTQKPIALFVDIIKYYANNNVNIIIDPFLGSGSTLIACEKTNRILYGQEIEPYYIDVITQRYINYTKSTDNCYLIRDGKKIPITEIGFEI